MARCDNKGAIREMETNFLMIPQKRDWEDAQQFCNVCLGGRLAVLDTCEKNAAARKATGPTAGTTLFADMTGNALKQVSIPFANMLGNAVKNMDVLASEEAHIGMKTFPFAGRHMYKWICPSGFENKPCMGGDAGPIMSDVADQRSTDMQSEGTYGEDWGWNMFDAARTYVSNEPLSIRKKEGSVYLTRGMWQNGTESDKRYFLCEYDRNNIPDSSASAYCMAEPGEETYTPPAMREEMESEKDHQ